MFDIYHQNVLYADNYIDPKKCLENNIEFVKQQHKNKAVLFERGQIELCGQLDRDTHNKSQNLLSTRPLDFRILNEDLLEDD